MLTSPSPPSDVSIPTPDGLVLLGRHWARPNPRGVVIVAHGFGEHGGCYRHVAEALGPALEVDFVAPDLRGHGRSPGRRGVVGRYEELTSDLRAVLAWAESERPGLPRFVLGHSNGGQVAPAAGTRGRGRAGGPDPVEPLAPHRGALAPLQAADRPVPAPRSRRG